MGERKSIRLENKQLDAAGEMERQGEADNRSEALRTAINVGFSEMGYLNGDGRETQDTRLRAVASRFGEAFGLLGLMWVGVSFFMPLEFRMLAIAPFAASAACFGLDRLLESVEPAVSQHLIRVFRGERA